MGTSWGWTCQTAASCPAKRGFGVLVLPEPCPMTPSPGHLHLSLLWHLGLGPVDLSSPHPSSPAFSCRRHARFPVALFPPFPGSHLSKSPSQLPTVRSSEASWRRGPCSCSPSPSPRPQAGPGLCPARLIPLGMVSLSSVQGALLTPCQALASGLTGEANPGPPEASISLWAGVHPPGV